MTVLLFIAVLALLVVGHELGHMLMAKLMGMKVVEFGIGFPPRIAGRKWGETEYTINWLLFGGFVRILGEDDTSNDPRAMHRRPVVAQGLVLLAGPGMNFVLAFVLFFAAYLVGVPGAIDPAQPIPPEARVVIEEVLPGSPAAHAGLKPGDEVVSLAINGHTTPVRVPDTIAGAVSSTDGPVTITLIRNHEPLTYVVAPRAGIVPDAPTHRAIGIATALVGVTHFSIIAAMRAAVVATYTNTVGILTSLLMLIGHALTLSADLTGVAGPVGIAGMTGSAAAFGLGSLLSFIALLSINLGVINLLPFPALDGGRILFLMLETIARRRIPLRVANWTNALGFGLLIALMMVVTWHDIVRLIGN